MTESTSSEWTLTDADSENLISELLAEIHFLNERMRNDQAEIDRLKVETRTIAAHTDSLLSQIEGQLNVLRMEAKDYENI